MGSGLVMSAIFVSLNAVVEPAHKAVAASGLYLSMPVGQMAGVAAASAVMLEVLQMSLFARLTELGLGAAIKTEVRRLHRLLLLGDMPVLLTIPPIQIIQQAAANVNYIDELEGPVAEAVVRSYVLGLRFSYGMQPAFPAVFGYWMRPTTN